jgi:hypothetical protein
MSVIQKKVNVAPEKWLAELDHDVIKLPEDAFKASGTSVKTRLVVIRVGEE